MTDTSPVLDFLSTRRSTPPRMLAAPGPDAPGIARLLELAARVPDHGKLEPWRFIVLGPQTRRALAQPLAEHARAVTGDDTKAAKAVDALNSPVIVAVVSAPVASDKVPEWEQRLSAGALCLGLVNAALASGWGAAWLSGPMTAGDFAQRHLGLAAGESLVGLVHIGTAQATPPDRPRPDIAAKTTVLP